MNYKDFVKATRESQFKLDQTKHIRIWCFISRRCYGSVRVQIAHLEVCRKDNRYHPLQ